MKLKKLLRRFLMPPFMVSVFYYLKYRAMVSPRAEVEVNEDLYIGSGSIVSSFTKVKVTGGRLSIGRNVSIGSNCFIGAGKGGMVLGNDCLIGPSVNIITNNYNYFKMDIPIRLQGTSSKGVKIGDNVWVGAGTSILDGTTIGSGCIVGSNSMVSGTFPDNVILQGNPAKIIFHRR